MTTIIFFPPITSVGKEFGKGIAGLRVPQPAAGEGKAEG